MKLTKDTKNIIDKYFDNLSPEEALDKAKEYGIMEEKKLVPELKSTERVFDKYFKIDEQIFTIPKEEGEDLEISRLRLNRPNAVAVLIYNKEKSTFTFVRQYRPAIGEKNDNEPILEIAAGLIDEGETSEEAAKREVIEETGYKVSNLELLHKYFPGVGYCSEKVWVYLATVTESDKVEDGGGLEIEGEMMEVVEFSLEDVYHDFHNGFFIDGKTIISLLEFKTRHTDELNLMYDQENKAQSEKIKDLELKVSLLEGKPTV
jgi:ADP-ribose pyrophosphatase